MKYVRIHQVDAEPMTRGDYNKFRGWTIPANENPAEDGYIVKYPDGYVSWCPKAQFENNAFSDAKDAPFRSIPDSDQLLMLLRIFHDERYSNCSCDEKATRLVQAYYNEYVGRPNGFLTFGMAIEAMKRGKKVARRGWNGKGMWLCVPLCDGPTEIPATRVWGKPNAEYALQNGGTVKVMPYVTMKTADGSIVMGWLASQTDMLAEDWEVVE